MSCCLCCSSECDLRSMLHPYDNHGTREIYATMITQCFGIQVRIELEEIYKHLYVICKACILCLRNAFQFRHRVETAYLRIQDLLDKNISGAGKCKSTSEISFIEVKSERESPEDAMDFDNFLSVHIKEELDVRHENNCNSNNNSNIKLNTLNKFKNCDLVNINARIDVKKSIKVKKKKIQSVKNKLGKKEVRERVAQFDLDKNELTCRICSETFAWHRNLKLHMAVHFPNYVCHICSKTFALQKSLYSHVRRHEQNKTLHTCDICNKSMEGKDNLTRHMKTHSDDVRLYKCPYCPEKFAYFQKRTTHLINVHNDDSKKYRCKHCNKSFNSSNRLFIHVKMSHLNEKRHACEICNISFYQKCDLTRHMLVHTGVKNFQCDVCNKSFSRNSNLKVHMRIHNNIKNFICPICNKAFTHNCTLKGHMKLHEKSEEQLKNI